MNVDQNHVFLIADDHSMIRQGMMLMVEEVCEGAEVIQASSLSQIKVLAEKKTFDFAVVDAHFPDGNILGILSEVKKNQPEMKILIFTGIDEETNVLRYLNAGADGFLSKLSEEEEITEALRSLTKEGAYLSKTARTLLLTSAQNKKQINPLLNLSQRELEIAEMYAKGHGNLEIANLLELKQNTVSTFKKRIFEKLNIASVVELAEIIREQR